MLDPARPPSPPLLQPLGDRGLIVRFASELSDAANRAAIGFAARLRTEAPQGVVEVQPSLVSVLLHYDPRRIGYERLAGEIRLLLAADASEMSAPAQHVVPVVFDGPDLDEVAAVLSLSREGFIQRHCEAPLRVLTTGFAPGFVYCGFHGEELAVPRRTAVRPPVPAGSILFAARQTAIASTPIPTGWHVIGHTGFRNFQPDSDPPTVLREGDAIRFEALS